MTSGEKNMRDRILFVDDNQAILDSYRRQLSPHFNVSVALGGEHALKAIDTEEAFKVIVSDLKMPGMDGVELLEKVKILIPETVRILLTGHADMESALNAVNRGAIFRFLTKPCPSEQLLNVLHEALEQYELVQARKEMHSLKKFKRAMEGVISGFSTILEVRDPYTAGHQKRVAEISCLIAKKMNFPQDQIDAMRIAGMLHDIGKVSVPSDFLNKPGVLKREEFDVIKMHPGIGADILKHVQFDWPISDIIRQHHERLDGSGYPQHLRGEEILLEARILAVADVLDAMSSHRPYRASLGLDAAIAELKSKEGVHFDPAVVRVCLEILRDEHEISSLYQ